MSATGLDTRKRIRLAELLAEAAELEHGLLCQYLFAAFSLKRHPDEGATWQQIEDIRRWEASLLRVARQEMEHLGLVNNLLTAIGEAPCFDRPDLPLPARHYPMRVASRLERLTPEAVVRFLLFEMPAELSPDERAVLDAAVPGFDPAHYSTIGALYAEIRGLLAELGSPELFIGPPGAQLDNSEVIPVPVRGVSLAGRAVYDFLLEPVTDTASALAAVDQILEEGEGTPVASETSHFAAFVAIHEGLARARAADPGFDPARPVLDGAGRDAEITHPATRRVAECFELAYGTLMLMLLRYFAHSDESEAELHGLQQAAFFPMMTAVIRPLGELLTLLPAHAHRPVPTAGPGFTYGRRLRLHPHRRAAWAVIGGQLDLLAAETQTLALEDAYPEPVRRRLGFLAENAARIARNFAAATEPA